MFAPFFCHWYLSGAVPAATTEKLAVCPAVTVWFAGGVVMGGATAAAVVGAVIEIVDVGICGSLLVIVIAPESFPAIVGEYVRFRVTLAPGRIVLGVVIPETPKGPGLTLTMEIVRLEPPTLLTVAAPCPVLPTVTVPRFTFVGLTLICGATRAALKLTPVMSVPFTVALWLPGVKS